MGMTKERTCKTCGETKPLTQKYFYRGTRKRINGQRYFGKSCKECRLKKTSYRIQNAKHSAYKRGSYRCVWEPAFTGYKDRLFHYRMFLLMLDDGLLPPGTVWQNQRTGRKYRIVGNEAYFKFPENFEDAKGQKLRWVR